MKFENGIPVVDLKGLPRLNILKETANVSDIAEVTLALDEGLKTYSCVYLENTGISIETVTTAFEMSKQFFDLPENNKLIYERGTVKGYDYLGYYRSTKEAFRQRFDFGLKSEDLGKFPEAAAPGITASVVQYEDAMNSVAKFLFRRMAEALKLDDEDKLIQLHRGALLDVKVESRTHLSSILYQNMLVEEDKVDEPGHGTEFLMGQHTDMSSITILASTSPGLQIQLPDGSGTWLDANPVHSCIFLQVGDLLEAASGGHYKATVHRVKRANEEIDSPGRQSIAYFVHPDAETMVMPLIDSPWKDNYSPVKAGDYFDTKKMNKKGTLGNDTLTPPTA